MCDFLYVYNVLRLMLRTEYNELVGKVGFFFFFFFFVMVYDVENVVLTSWLSFEHFFCVCNF